MAVRKPSCTLESLNTDIQIAILSTSPSANDLYRLLRASPVLYYQTFLPHKLFILLRLNFNLLGPVGLRDAIFLSHTYTSDHDPSKILHGDRCWIACRSLRPFLKAPLDKIIDVYRNLTFQTTDEDGCPLSDELKWDTILAVTHLAKTAVYLSDLYIRSRFSYFRRNFYPYFNWGNDEWEDAISNNPWCDWQASITEQHRIRTAILRNEIARGFDGEFPGSGSHLPSPGGRMEQFLCKVFPVYEAWEWEQISQIDRFLIALMKLREHNDLRYRRDGRTLASWKKEPGWRVGLWRRYREEFRRNMNPGAYRGVLGRLHRDLEEVESFAPGLFGDVVVGRACGFPVENWICWLEGSDTWQRMLNGPPSQMSDGDVDWVDEEGARGLGMFFLLPVVMRAEKRFRPDMFRFVGDQVGHGGDPPWAWVDAMDGRNHAHVWGVSLAGLPEARYTGSGRYSRNNSEMEYGTASGANVELDELHPERLERRKRVLELWRQMGLVFWDKKRAERIIKQTQGTETWGTGWLERWIRLYYIPRPGGIQVDHYGLDSELSGQGGQVGRPPQFTSQVAAGGEGPEEASLWEYQVNV